MNNCCLVSIIESGPISSSVKGPCTFLYIWVWFSRNFQSQSFYIASCLLVQVTYVRVCVIGNACLVKSLIEIKCFVVLVVSVLFLDCLGCRLACL